MMISIDEAKHLAEEALSTLAAASGDEYGMVYDSTVEVGEGWVFFYNSKDFIETGNASSALAGNGPIFVDRGGIVRNLPSSVAWETAIKSA